MRGTRWATIASSSAAVVTTCDSSASGSETSSGNPARCTTASSLPPVDRAANTAATASASVQSASCQGSSVPSGAGTRSSPTTSWPRSVRPTVTTRPRLPAAPVTRTRIRPTLRPRDDLAEQAAHPARGGLARLEHLGVVERLAAQAGGEVGDQADAEDLHARLARRDGLEGGAHADQVAAHDAGHPDLGGGLVVGAGELDVDALVEARVDLLAQRAQARAVEVGEVDEVGADDRARAGEVDVVGDQHRLAGLPALLEAAAPVGQHDRRAAGGGRRTDRVDDRGDALALVEVGAGEEDEEVLVTAADRADLAAVADDGRGAEARQVGRVDLGRGLAERVDGREPARAEDEGDVVALDAGQLGEPRGCGGGGVVRVLVAHGPHSRASGEVAQSPVERHERRRRAWT